MINDTLKDAEKKMDKAVEVTREDFAAIRTGRAHPSMFHKITADYYGTPDAAAAARVLHRRPRRGSSSSAPSTTSAMSPSRRPSVTPTSA